jgi:hypothetical protein
MKTDEKRQGTQMHSGVQVSALTSAATRKQTPESMILNPTGPG